MRTVNTRAKHGYITPMAAIRNKCLDCCCWNAAEVTRCELTKCALHPYRFGRNPQTTDFQATGSANAKEGLQGYPDTSPEGNNENNALGSACSAQERAIAANTSTGLEKAPSAAAGKQIAQGA